MMQWNAHQADNAKVIDTLHGIIQAIIDMSQDTPRNVQHNNAQNAVLFEAINLGIHLDPDSKVVSNASILLGRFILAKETNVRYLGLDAMAHLAACSNTLEPVKKHQDTIILSLKDRDISVRRRALDLLYSMCDTSNSKVIVGELVKYLQSADYNLREEMVLKIAILTERFATEVSRFSTVLPANGLADKTVRVVRRYDITAHIGRWRPRWCRSVVQSRSACDQ